MTFKSLRVLSFIRTYNETGMILVSLLVGALSVPTWHLTFFPGIDGPLPWVFNHIADGHYHLAKNMLFPHGPLAFLLYPLPMGNNLFVAVLVHILCAAMLCYLFLQIFRDLSFGKIYLGALVSLIVIAYSDLQLIIISITSLCLVQSLNKTTGIYLETAALFAILNLFIKSYGGAICSIMIAFACFSHLAGRRFLPAFRLVGFFILWYLLFRIALFGSLDGAFDFIIGQIQLASDNSEATAYYQGNNWWMLSLSIISIVLMPLCIAGHLARRYYFMMLIPLFAAWKHGMTRADNIHISGYLSFIVVFVVILLTLTEGKKLMPLICGLGAIVFFNLDMALTTHDNDYDLQKDIALIKPYTLYHLAADYDSVAGEKIRESTRLNSTEYLPDSMRRLIGKATVDVFPWNHSLIPVNHLNWNPAPVICSYAAYTGWLDRRNAMHYINSNSAKFVIWCIDQLGGKLAGIDYRYLLNDQPEALIQFFARYRLKYKHERWLLFEQTDETVHVERLTVSPPMEAEYGNWIDVPSDYTGGVLRARLEIRKSLTGAVKSFFYKGESISVFCEDENGTVFQHKIVPGNAEDGVWLSPLIHLPGSGDREPDIRRFKVVCHDPSMLTEQFSVSLESISFVMNSKETPVDFAAYYFGKHRVLQQTPAYKP